MRWPSFASTCRWRSSAPIMASVFGFRDQEVFEISFPVIGLIAWGAYLVCLGTYRRTDLDCGPWEDRYNDWQLSLVYLSPLANFPGPKLAGECNFTLDINSCFARPFAASDMDWRGVEEEKHCWGSRASSHHMVPGILRHMAQRQVCLENQGDARPIW